MNTACAFAACCLVLTALPAFSEEPKPSEETPSAAGVGELREKFLYFHGTFGPQKLRQGGKDVEVGFLGSGLEEVVGEFPDARAAAHSARTFMLVGGSLYVVGVTILVVDLVLILVQPTWA